jgi:hypothetical protein
LRLSSAQSAARVSMFPISILDFNPRSQRKGERNR